MGGSGWAELMKAVHDSLNDSPDHPEVEAPPGSPAFLARRNHAMAAAAFKDMLPVLRHPRCLNCHSDMTFFDQPAGEMWDSKTSTTYMEPAVAATHPGGALDLITPTPENSGMTDCRDCHIYAPRQWQTGPTWVGLDDYDLCQKMKASRFNGEMFIEHIRDDALIKLAFVGRRAMDESPQPPPMPHGQFLSGVRKWINYMDAMEKYPRSRSEGCPRLDQWRGAIEYTYTETKPHDKFESHGMVHVFDGHVRWNGLATLREDHSAKGCPSVKSANAIGSGDATFVVMDITSETPLRGITMPMPGADGKAKVPRDDGKTPAKIPLLLTVLQDQYGIVIDLDLIGSSRYYGGGPACPGFRPNEAPYAALIQETMNGKFDPDNPDELSGTKSTTPFPGASLTLKWKLERLDEYR